MTNSKLILQDKDHLIHSAVNFRAHERKGVTIFESARGVYVKDANGNELLDAFSGLWCVNVGYGQESIVRVADESITLFNELLSFWIRACNIISCKTGRNYA